MNFFLASSALRHRLSQASAIGGSKLGFSVKSPWTLPLKTQAFMSPLVAKNSLLTSLASQTGMPLDRKYFSTLSAGTRASWSPMKTVQGLLIWSTNNAIQIHGKARCFLSRYKICVKTKNRTSYIRSESNGWFYLPELSNSPWGQSEPWRTLPQGLVYDRQSFL